MSSNDNARAVIPCRAVLFDFDGVIADTMEANLRAWQRAFSVHGAHVLAEDYLPLEGMSPADVAVALGTKCGLAGEAVRETPLLKERFFLQGEKCAIFPAVPALLADLRAAGILLALVTGASRLRLESSLPQELLAFFDAYVTADCTTRGKPSPDPFLRAAESVGLGPADCVVVENAPLGIASAKRAGMRCVAVCSTLGPESLQEADYIVADLEEAGRLLLPG